VGARAEEQSLFERKQEVPKPQKLRRGLNINHFIEDHKKYSHLPMTKKYQ
jgi:hypothetical protein